MGNGDGTFQPAADVNAGNRKFPDSLVAGDFTGDGRLDLAVADNGTNSVYVLMGNGDGTFQRPTESFAVGSGNGPRRHRGGRFQR